MIGKVNRISRQIVVVVNIDFWGDRDAVGLAGSSEL